MSPPVWCPARSFPSSFRDLRRLPAREPGICCCLCTVKSRFRTSPLRGFVRNDAQLAKIDARLGELARQDPLCQRLLAIEGIGPISATALAASLGEGPRFTRSRQFAASLGLVPREHSSGHQRRLGSITKRGNGYLRYLLVHGARSVIRTSGHKTDPRSRWLQALMARAGHNRTTVALANKNARIVWAVFHSGQPYRPACA